MGIAENLSQIRNRIKDAEVAYHRKPNSVHLLAISKKQTVTSIREAYQAGQVAFGESFLQEAVEKQGLLPNFPIEWHFIGNIQSNKTKKIVEHFSWVHSLNCLKIAKRFNDQRPEHLPPLNVCIEVNMDNDPKKSGCTSETVLELATAIQTLNRLKLRGLMTIPKRHINFSSQKAGFDRLAMLQNQLVKKGFALDTLSMGMTQDFEAAIAAGSTMVRIGTAIFGERP